ncbi:MAG: vWA domain-containing protein [Fibrobacteria bacterium]
MRWSLLFAFPQLFLGLNAVACCEENGADIVFILDNSSSMWSHRATIDPDTHDTTFWNANGACQSSASSNILSYMVQDTAFNRPPQSLNKSLPLLPFSQTSCREYAGDPYNERGVLIRNAIEYLAQTAPTSTAAVMGFAVAIENPQPPLQLNVVANVMQVKSMVRLDSVPATNYGPPLLLARNWLNDTSYIKTRKRAIVFISDGAPTDGNQGFNSVDSTMPPIYSIFLGKRSTPDTVYLKSLSDRSGGSFTRIDPSHPASMNSMMSTIIQQIATSIGRSSKIVANPRIGGKNADALGRLVTNKNRSAGFIMAPPVGQ